MADNNDSESLKLEVERLTRELDETSSQKIQSAQYGLVLLAEKNRLDKHCNELEALYEATKHDLQLTQEVSTARGFN